MNQQPQSRPYKVSTALTQEEKDKLTKRMLLTKMNEPTILLLALNNLFYAMERYDEGYTEVSFVNKEGEVYQAPVIQLPGGG